MTVSRLRVLATWIFSIRENQRFYLVSFSACSGYSNQSITFSSNVEKHANICNVMLKQNQFYPVENGSEQFLLTVAHIIPSSVCVCVVVEAQRTKRTHRNIYIYRWFQGHLTNTPREATTKKTVHENLLSERKRIQCLLKFNVAQFNFNRKCFIRMHQLV